MRRFQAQIRKRVAAFWRQCNRREQLMLTAATGFAFFALVFMLLIDPALSGRKRLQISLPTSHRQAMELQQLLAEAAALPDIAARPLMPLARSNIETALIRSGLSSKSIAVTGDSAKLEFSASSFAGLVHFLQDIQKAENLRVSEAKFSTAAKPGLVDATVTLLRKRSE